VNELLGDPLSVRIVNLNLFMITFNIQSQTLNARHLTQLFTTLFGSLMGSRPQSIVSNMTYMINY